MGLGVRNSILDMFIWGAQGTSEHIILELRKGRSKLGRVTRKGWVALAFGPVCTAQGT